MPCLIQEEKQPPKSVTNLPTARGHMSRPSAAHTLLTGGNVLRSVAAGPALKQQGPAVAHWLFIGKQQQPLHSQGFQLQGCYFTFLKKIVFCLLPRGPVL